MLSADHGVGPVPVHAVTLGLPARRNPLGPLADLSKRMEAHLQKQFGAPPGRLTYVDKLETSQVYLHEEAVGKSAERFRTLQESARDFLRGLPGVAVAVTRAELQSKDEITIVLDESWKSLLAPGTTMEQALRRSFSAEHSGDVLFALLPYQAQSSLRATHGSPWRYDTHVPLLLLGHGVRNGSFDRPVSPAAIAPSIALVLGIDPPAKNEELPVREALIR